MADDFDNVVDNVKSSSTWMRIVYMIGFCIVLYVVSVVIWFLTGAQALFAIFTGSDNRNLRQLGASLAEYVNQILRFITFNSESRPFPFSPFPEGEPADAEPADSDTENIRTGGVAGDNEDPGAEAGDQFDDLAFLSRQDEMAEEELPEQQEEELVETDNEVESEEQAAEPDGEREPDENPVGPDEEEFIEDSAKNSKEEKLAASPRDSNDNDARNSG